MVRKECDLIECFSCSASHLMASNSGPMYYIHKDAFEIDESPLKCL